MNMRKLTALVLSLLLIFSLCACGSSAKGSSSGYYAASAPAAAPVPAPAAQANGFYADEAAYDMEYPMEAEEAGFGLSGSTAKTESGKEAPEANPEKIIYSADATVETTEFDKSIAALEQLLADCGGFVESSSVNGNNYYDSARGNVSRRTANYTLRIPSAKFSGVMNSLETLGNVPYTYMYTENVTAQYYDVEARMKAYEKQEERLLEMMDLAENVEDIITIEDKLTDVRYRIDSLQSSLNNWDRRVSYSTLSLTVKEVQVYTPETVTKITYGERLVNAFKDSLAGTGRFFQNLLIFLVSILPAVVILAVLFFVCRPLLKKLWAKGAERRARKAADKAARKALKAQTRAEKKAAKAAPAPEEEHKAE